MRKDWGKR